MAVKFSTDKWKVKSGGGVGEAKFQLSGQSCCLTVTVRGEKWGEFAKKICEENLWGEFANKICEENLKDSLQGEFSRGSGEEGAEIGGEWEGFPWCQNGWRSDSGRLDHIYISQNKIVSTFLPCHFWKILHLGIYNNYMYEYLLGRYFAEFFELLENGSKWTPTSQDLLWAFDNLEELLCQ